MSSTRKRVSVIIPVYNGGGEFHTCLAALSGCEPSPDEIIVVADGDSDGSWRTAENFNAKILKMRVSEGPARARNMGARKARGEILFFVDADVAVAKDAVGIVIYAFQNNNELAAAIGSYDDEPMEKNFLSQYKNLFHHYVHQNSNTDASTFWGACGAVRREVFFSTGGFNEGYRRPSIEDIELGYRLKKAGHTIKLMKNLRCKHLKHWGIVSLLRADFFYRALPWARLILKDRRLINDLNLNISTRASIISIYIFIFSLLSSLYISWMYIIALPLFILLILLNLDLYRFFTEKRGLLFMLKTIPWHWFYFLYSGLAFSMALIEHSVRFILRKPDNPIHGI
jgi:glycosyltransferase involved in cell wall biosynthesis